MLKIMVQFTACHTDRPQWCSVLTVHWLWLEIRRAWPLTLKTARSLPFPIKLYFRITKYLIKLSSFRVSTDRNERIKYHHLISPQETGNFEALATRVIWPSFWRDLIAVSQLHWPISSPLEVQWPEPYFMIQYSKKCIISSMKLSIS